MFMMVKLTVIDGVKPVESQTSDSDHFAELPD